MPMAAGVYGHSCALHNKSKRNMPGRFQTLVLQENDFFLVLQGLKILSGAIKALTSGGLCCDEICDMVTRKGRQLSLDTRGL